MSEKSESLRRYEELQKESKRLTRDYDRAQGALDQQTAVLQDEFDCSTIADGRELLDRLENEVRIAERKFKKALDKFDDKWESKLLEVE